MARIERIHAREVFDSRGKPTVEVEVVCEGARPGRAIVPSGASTGRFEALELRDGDTGRFDGSGVTRAVNHVCRQISDALVGEDAGDQQQIDRKLCELDGTQDKSALGANALLGVSLASAYAAAEATGRNPVDWMQEIWQRIPRSSTTGERSNRTADLADRPLLPLPMVNMISGGKHAGGNLDFQDFLILPVGAESYRQALEWIITIYRRVGQMLTEHGFDGVLVGDEGGYGPQLGSNSEAVECIVAAIEACGLRPGDDVALGLDVAASHFFDEGTYRLAATGDTRLEADEIIEMLTNWVDNYPIVSIEDALAEDDWEGWKKLTEQLGDRVQLIGDDLFVTNTRRLQQGISTNTANSVLVKFNQIGTLWETLETLRMAIDSGYWPVVSARSGETEDTTIADLVVATGAGQIKVGSVARSERLAKYNQLLRIEEKMGSGHYLGGAIFSALGWNKS